MSLKYLVFTLLLPMCIVSSVLADSYTAESFLIDGEDVEVSAVSPSGQYLVARRTQSFDDQTFYVFDRSSGNFKQRELPLSERILGIDDTGSVYVLSISSVTACSALPASPEKLTRKTLLDEETVLISTSRSRSFGAITVGTSYIIVNVLGGKFKQEGGRNPLCRFVPETSSVSAIKVSDTQLVTVIDSSKNTEVSATELTSGEFVFFARDYIRKQGLGWAMLSADGTISNPSWPTKNISRVIGTYQTKIVLEKEKATRKSALLDPLAATLSDFEGVPSKSEFFVASGETAISTSLLSDFRKVPFASSDYPFLVVTPRGLRTDLGCLLPVGYSLELLPFPKLLPDGKILVFGSHYTVSNSGTEYESSRRSSVLLTPSDSEVNSCLSGTIEVDSCGADFRRTFKDGRIQYQPRGALMKTSSCKVKASLKLANGSSAADVPVFASWYLRGQNFENQSSSDVNGDATVDVSQDALCKKRFVDVRVGGVSSPFRPYFFSVASPRGCRNKHHDQK